MKKIGMALFGAALTLFSMNLPAEERVAIAIIGTGDMGDSLGPKLAETGYQVIYGSRDPSRDSIKALVARTGNDAVATTQEAAAQKANMVLLAVPWPAMEYVAQNLGDLDGKIVIDISSPYRQAADGYMEMSVETSSAEMIQSWNPGARVVKTQFAGSFVIDNPMVLGVPISTHIAADDRSAKEIVAKLIFELGLDPVDAGPLRNARYIEGMAILYNVPLLQRRNEAYEMVLLRSSFWPCVWQDEWRRPVADADDLAQFPESKSVPKPCSSYPPYP